MGGPVAVPLEGPAAGPPLPAQQQAVGNNGDGAEGHHASGNGRAEGYAVRRYKHAGRDGYPHDVVQHGPGQVLPDLAEGVPSQRYGLHHLRPVTEGILVLFQKESGGRNLENREGQLREVGGLKEMRQGVDPPTCPTGGKVADEEWGRV